MWQQQSKEDVMNASFSYINSMAVIPSLCAFTIFNDSTIIYSLNTYTLYLIATAVSNNPSSTP
jgi:hypothetical protein